MRRLALAALALALPAAAELYEWKDERGVTHFSSRPPQSASRGVKTIKTGRHPSFSPPPDAGARTAPGDKNQPGAPKIELYTTSWCGVCTSARAYLGRRGFAYQEYDIERDAEAYRRYKGYGGQGVPLAVIDGTIFRGFSSQAYDQALAERKTARQP